MKLFDKPESNLDTVVNNYKQGREVLKVSVPVSYKGKKYREIVYNAAGLFGGAKDTVNGIIFIDENNNAVTDKVKQRELSKVFYDVEQLLDGELLKNLEKAIVSEKSLKIEELQGEFLEANLMLLTERKVNGADKVKDVVTKLPDLKRENNKAIENFISKANEIMQESIIDYEKVASEAKPLYRETLMKNFQKVKLIGTGRNYYGDVRKAAIKIFRKNMLTRSSDMGGSVSQFDYELSNLTQVVNVYNSVIDMSTSEYSEFLNSMDKQGISEKLDQNRAK